MTAPLEMRPTRPAGVVCAFDATHDPVHKADMNIISEKIKASGHPSLKYIIWNRHIWSKLRKAEGWRPYHGSNPHNHHAHISVNADYDDISPWGLANLTIIPLLKLTHPYMRGEIIRRIQTLLHITNDGVFGPQTERAVKQYQVEHNLQADGIVGPLTLQTMGVKV